MDEQLETNKKQHTILGITKMAETPKSKNVLVVPASRRNKNAT